MLHYSSFIERLRQRPLSQRYLIMWAASIGVFLLIFWIWLFQVEYQLASLSNQTPFATTSGAPKEPLQKVQSAQGPSQLGQLFESIKEGTASLVSFFGSFSDTTQSSPNDAKPAPRQGDELDQFLNYQPFPKE